MSVSHRGDRKRSNQMGRLVPGSYLGKAMVSILLPLAFATIPLSCKNTLGETKRTPEVLRLSCSTFAGAPRQGSAVCLAKQEGQIGYFATCYHVLQDAKVVTLETLSGESVSFNVAETGEFVVKRANDLVLFRLHLKPKFYQSLVAACAAHELAESVQTANLDLTTYDSGRTTTSGFALGFPYLDRRQQFRVPVGIWGDVPALNLELFSKERLGGIDYLPRLERTAATFAFLSNEITLPGMSGGGVFTAEEPARFSGLVIGRIPDTQGLMIPSRHVVAALLSLIEKEPTQQGNGVDKLKPKVPLSQVVRQQFSDLNVVSDMQWATFASWALAFESGQRVQATLDEFQEIRVDTGMLTKDVTNLTYVDLYASERVSSTPRRIKTEQELRAMGYDFTVNGARWKPNTDGTWPIDSTSSTVMVRKRKRGDEPVFNDLFANKNEIHFRIQVPDGRSVSVRRSLPGVFQSYAVFLTIENENVAEPSYESELLISVSELRRLLGGNVVENIPVEIRPSKQGSYVVAQVDSGDLKSVSIERLSPHSLVIDFPLTIRIINGEIREYGLIVKIPSKTIEMRVRGLLQVVKSRDGRLGVSIRATSARCSPLPIEFVKLGGDESEKATPISMDVANIFSQATVAYLNKEHLSPHQSRQEILRFLDLVDPDGVRRDIESKELLDIDFVRDTDGNVFIRACYGKPVDRRDDIRDPTSLIQSMGDFILEASDEEQKSKWTVDRLRWRGMKLNVDDLTLDIPTMRSLKATGRVSWNNLRLDRHKQNFLSVPDASSEFAVDWKKNGRGRDQFEIYVENGFTMTLCPDGSVTVPPVTFTSGTKTRETVSEWGKKILKELTSE